MAIEWQQVGETSANRLSTIGTQESSGMQDIFSRLQLLLGDEAMDRIAEKRVIIFGFMLAGHVIQDAIN